MGRPMRKYTRQEKAGIRADRAEGMSVRDLEIKYKTSRGTLIATGLVEPAGRRRRRKGSVEDVNAALDRAGKPDKSVPHMLTYIGGGEERTEEHESLDRALAACAGYQLAGAGSLRLWREVKFKVTAVVEEE